MEKLIITPKIKIYDLLQSYPELEDVLIEAAPQFKKLKNPILRKTIARVTTLGQAASVGGIKVEDLVNLLREKAGQEGLSGFVDEQASYITKSQEWFSPEKIEKTIDIRDMLNEGEQPVHEVLSAIKHLENNTILEVIAPFLPAPLIDKAISLGYKYWVLEKSDTDFRVYLSK